MGAGDSKVSSSTSYPNLKQEQVDEARVHFSKLTRKEMNKEEFQKWHTNLGDLTDLIFNSLAINGVLKEEVFLDATNKLGGDCDDASTILLKIHGTTKNILSQVVDTFARYHNAANTDALLQFLLKDAPKDDSRLSNYLISNPLAGSLIRSVYAPLWGGERSSILPKLAGNTNLFNSACSVALLNAHLPMESRRLWTLLFSSTHHGSSFSQLQKRICGEGPCLVVIKSTNERVFGCFASEGFLSGPQYRGDATCFLFQLAPELNIYSATGTCDQYAYLNAQQETLPNGLGIGGLEDVWPLFIHEEYGKGITCRSVSSFEKCCLSGQQEFDIKELEVWRVGQKRGLSIDEGERIRSPKSILDKDPEAKALLEMSGRSMHSEAYREPEPILDNEEEWQK